MPTLQDLLAGLQDGQQPQNYGHLARALAPLMGGGMGQGGPGPAGPGPTDYDSLIKQQIDERSQPEPYQEIPVGNDSKLWQRILGSVADAGSVYARGINPYVPTTHTLGGLMEGDARNQDARAVNKYRKEKAGSDARNTKAEMELRRLMNEKAGQAQSQAHAEDVKLRQAELKAKTLADQAELQQKQAFESEQQKQQQAFLLQMEQVKQRGDMGLAKLREKINAGDKFAGEQRKILSEAYAGVSEISAGLDAALEQGMSPDVIRKTFMRKLKELGLEGEARDAAIADFSEEIEPRLTSAESKVLLPQGPEQPGRFAPALANPAVTGERYSRPSP